nr:polysaccharide pyruvyl transferase family protein [Pantoea sp. 201603H]
MDKLKNDLSVIDTVVPPGSKVVYLDIPLHLNVGDLLIYKGTEQFIKERGHKVISRRTDKTSMKWISENKYLPKDVIILMHGGGNFGDLYGHHQRLREAVVENYPEHKIVYLPQTAHFKDENKMLRSAEIISKHSKLTIFCRDERSKHLMEKYFCNDVRLCPDMAHSLWNIFPRQKTEYINRETLWMIRKDIEETNVEGLPGMPGPEGYEDWEDICSDNDRAKTRLLLNFERINRMLNTRIFDTPAKWDAYTDKLVSRVNNYFMSHDMVVTSRMHGHILCCLLGMKTRLLDNSYGKNSGYYASWTKDVPECELITL